MLMSAAIHLATTGAAVLDRLAIAGVAGNLCNRWRRWFGLAKFFSFNPSIFSVGVVGGSGWALVGWTAMDSDDSLNLAACVACDRL